MNTGPIARWYRWIEYSVYGRALERRRFAYLSRLSGCRRILILGEGDGRALSRLLTLAPQAEFDVVELSAEMIALARARLGPSAHRVTFLRQDALQTKLPRETYDGVVTLFFLDCFNVSSLRIIIAQIRAAMTADARWLVSDFAIPEGGWAHWHARILIWIMYQFFGLTTGLKVRKLPPIARLLKQSGLELLESSEERAGLIRSEVWQIPPALS
jgi:SAM-dependent methyltransferase